jgi:Protein of unknown function (DUF3034)
MKKSSLFIALAALTIVLLVKPSYAGVPLNNLEGVGGIAFNPVAYTAGTEFEKGENASDLSPGSVFNKPQFGIWYVSLPHVSVDWTAIGVADTLFKRLEVSYGYETVNQENASAKHKNNLGAKLLLLPENSFETKYVPAVSVGTVYKQTSHLGAGADDNDYDVYVVATKLITQLPRPVLLSGGVLSTKEKATGVFGFGDKRKETGFANIDVILPHDLALGFEYKQGAREPGFRNADYWDAHLAWLANKNLSLVLAYVDAGDYKSTSKVGLGDGVVLSAHYQF